MTQTRPAHIPTPRRILAYYGYAKKYLDKSVGTIHNHEYEDLLYNGEDLRTELIDLCRQQNLRHHPDNKEVYVFEASNGKNLRGYVERFYFSRRQL